MEDKVLKPNHYTFSNNGIELTDAWRSSMSKEALCGFFKGNVMKYLWRYEHKNGVEDLKKARQYLNWLIMELEDHKND